MWIMGRLILTKVGQPSGRRLFVLLVGWGRWVDHNRLGVAQVAGGRADFLCCALACFCFLLNPATMAAPGPKKVLVVHSFGTAAPPFTTHSKAFETELTEKIGERVDLDEVSLDMARYAQEDDQAALVDYLAKRQAKWQPDLVVPVGSPAGVFVAQFRDRLFPAASILYCGMDRRRLPADALEKNAAFIGENYVIAGFVEDILQIAPATTNIAVVLGASPVEQYWAAAFRKEFEPFTNKVGFTWLNDLSFDQMLDRVSKLPPHSFIFMVLLLRDATGVTHNANEALKRIHDVANAPMNGIFLSQMGMGIVGGRLYPDELEGIESARLAIRILHGEPASSFPPRILSALEPRYDWRELRRWKLSEAHLPKGSVVQYREPTLWDHYKLWIIAGISLCAAQALLISGLIANSVRRRLAEASLRESQERMKLAASAAQLGLWEWDMATDRVWVAGRNPGKPSLRDESHADYARFMQAIHPDDRDRVARGVAKAMSGGGEYDDTHRMVMPDGRVRWIAARGRVEFDKEHKPLRMRGIAFDITERKQAEERAEESERRFLEIANSAPVLIWASGMDKLCTFFNQPWLEFTGRTLEEEMGEGWTEAVHPDDLAQCMKVYEQAFAARRSFTMEFRLRRHDGEYRWLSDHGVPRYDAEKNFLGYMGSCVDISEQRNATEEAERSREQLAHLTRVSTLGELGGSLAHELNQPLTAILSNAQAASRFLEQGPANMDEVREILKDIVEEDRRAGEIILRMRGMLKKEEVKMLPQDLNEIVREVQGLLRSELLIRNVTAITRLEPDLPQVRGDHVRLQQVLMNLMINACEAMGSMPRTARVITIATQALDDGIVQASVADTGPGFAAENSTPMFEPFRTTKANGLGLGLPICRSIVESHGGQFRVSNGIKGGALIRFTLKIHEET
jgi:PAS domain S-box-containing protein